MRTIAAGTGLVRRRTEGVGDERGQTLVEYALIIAIVALGAIVSLSFLSGKVNTLFSNAGNSLDAVEATGAGGPGAPGGPSGGSAPATPTITSGPAEGSSGNTAAFTSPSFGFTGDGTETGFECRIDGGVFTACTSPQGYSSLSAGPHSFQVQASNGSGTSAPATRSWTVSVQAPQPGSVSVGSLNPPADDGDTIRANANTFSNSPTSYEFEWEHASSSGSNCTNPGTATVVSVSGPDAFNDFVTGEFSGNNQHRCFRARARATNAGGTGPWSSFSAWLWVQD
jgi:Flp pilus assembly pilin Flp